ncbi:hypothetical protein BT69DRAFT_1348630 [Atractiella rhizophila]|nr:hypothetical protein BT69DRAFT_1348630 [Atractiella rhizophila]
MKPPSTRPSASLYGLLRRPNHAPRRFQSTSNSPPPPRSPAPASRIGLALGFAAVALGSYGTALYYPPSFLSLLSPPPSAVLGPAPEPESAEWKALLESREKELWDLDVVKKLQEEVWEHPIPATGWNPDWQTLDDRYVLPSGAVKKYFLSRPYRNLPPEKRQHSLTATALFGPGRITPVPLLFFTPDRTELVIVLHLGRSVCGHDGLVHGGLAATLMDEATARVACEALDAKVGVTARLEVDYRKMVKADGWYLIRSKLERKEGRKAYAKSTLESLEGETLVEAKALFVQPKLATLIPAREMRKTLSEYA